MQNLRLNLGCGKHVLEGWFNIDIQRSPKAHRDPEMFSDVKKIDLPDGCASEIQAIHLWEHLYRWECDDVIQEWRRLLKVGGAITLEMPDIFKFCQNILEGKKARHVDQIGLWGMYGDPSTRDPYMTHRWGWTFASIKPFLEGNGFRDIKEETPKYHAVGRLVRDFRITGRKS